MQNHTLLNTSIGDGKVLLSKEKLKKLRKSIGASQEKLAFMCAEKGLCVSIASIKRAETSKHVLYRTATELAKFYSVDFPDILDDAIEPESQPALSRSHTAPQPHTTTLITKRHAVFLALELYAPDTDLNIQQIQQTLMPLVEQFDSEFIEATKQHIYFAFGTGHSRGNESSRALFFAQKVIQLLELISQNTFEYKCALCWQEIINSGYEKEGASHQCNTQELNQLLAIAPANKIFFCEEIRSTLTNIDIEAERHPVASVATPFWELRSIKEVDNNKNTDLIGRKTEINIFKAIIESSKEYGITQVIGLIGIAGIGKSQLVASLEDIARLEGIQTNKFCFSDFYTNNRYHVIPQLTRYLISEKSLETLKNKQIPYASLPSRLATHPHILPLLYFLLDWDIDDAWKKDLDSYRADTLLNSTTEIISELLVRKTHDTPLLIILEDCHWANEKEEELLNSLIHALKDRPIVFLLSSRPGDFEKSVLAGHTASITKLNLRGLTSSEAQVLASKYPEIDQDYKNICIKRSQGNPLFLDQLLRDYGSLHSNNLPRTLQNTILSRLDSFNDRDKLAASSAAVAGRNFELSLLQHLISDTHYTPTKLVEQSILNKKTETHYEFVHALITDGIYQSISDIDRANLHKKCADWYKDDEIIQLRHLLKGKRPEALNKIVPIINDLKEKYQLATALELIELGETIFPQLNTHAEYLILAADTYKLLGKTTKSLDKYSIITTLDITPTLQIKALIGQSYAFNLLDNPEQALAAIQSAHAIAQLHHSVAELALIEHQWGNILFPMGEPDACIEHQTHSLAHAETCGDIELKAKALGGLGDAYYAQGRMGKAYTQLKACIQLCDEHQLNHVASANLFMLGTVRIYQLELDQALRDVSKSIALSEVVGNKRSEIVARLTASWILVDLEQLDDATHHIDLAITLAKQLKAKRFIPFLEESQAQVLLKQNKIEAARETIEVALKRVKELEAQSFIGPWLFGTASLIAAKLGNTEQSLAYLEAGETTLNNGCIGHNYFRFYRYAIDTALKLDKKALAEKYRQALKTFTAEDPTPWSNDAISAQ